MSKTFKHTCDRCRLVTIEATGTVIENSHDAAMNPYRVFVSIGKFELWCDECIEAKGRFCPACIKDDSRPEHYYSRKYAEKLGNTCQYCGLPLACHERKMQSAEPVPDEIRIDEPVPIKPPAIIPVPPANVQMVFRIP